MLNKSYKHIFLGTFLFLSTSSAFAALRLSAGAIGGATGVDVSSNSASESASLIDRQKFGYGAGALLEVPMVSFFGLETGALYIHRRFDIENASAKITRTVPTVLVPIEAKFWIGDVVTIAAGVFGALKVGSTKDEVRSGNVTISNEFSNNNRKGMEYGLTAAVGLNIPIWNKTGLFAEARYNHGLSDASESNTFEEKMRDVLFMAGVRLELGGDDPGPDHVETTTMPTPAVEQTELAATP